MIGRSLENFLCVEPVIIEADFCQCTGASKSARKNLAQASDRGISERRTGILRISLNSRRCTIASAEFSSRLEY